ncbi:MAG: phosphohydrolase [Flavobacteriaceae bacterium]|nr:phosphohydrolase [Flavobacteriaceae bacterium]
MSKFFNSINKGFSRIFRILLFLISTFLIIYFFPKSGKFKYNFENGRPWQSENLYAPFDFAIKKSQEEIDEEITQAKINTPLFFEIDTSLITGSNNLLITRIAELKNDSLFNLLKEEDVKKIKIQSSEIIEVVYSKGLLEENFDFKDSQQISILLDNKLVNSTYYTKLIKPQDLITFINNKIIETSSEKYKSQIISLVFDIITPNLSYNKVLSDEAINEATINISPNRGFIEKETLIISKGEVVEGEKLKVLESLKKEYEVNSSSFSDLYLIISAYSLLVILSLLMIVLFIRKFERNIYDNNNKIAFVYFNITLIILITTWVVDVNSNYIYIIPLCIIPLLFKAFFDSRIAFFIHSVTIMLLGFVVPNSYEFIFLNIIAGVVTILTSDNIYKRANLFIAVAQITLVYMLAYFSFYVIQEGNIENLELNNFALFILCGLLTLFIYPLIYIHEKLFSLVSDVSLLELSDTNSNLLKELSNKAPGTFHHSLNVANLAEACANEIKANALLSRVGALHHDIGKINNPSYFTENQISEQNPHDRIPGQESVKIIKQHVSDGVKLAKNAGIPERIIEFIKTHHGTNLISYFYSKELKNSDNINEKDFCYNGPKPFSIEMAIVMMCDSVEAATKSLDKPTNEKIDSFVENIIDKQIKDEQFVNCELTFKNISTIKSVLKYKLKNIYHVRIEYPEISK